MPRRARTQFVKNSSKWLRAPFESDSLTPLEQHRALQQRPLQAERLRLVRRHQRAPCVRVLRQPLDGALQRATVALRQERVAHVCGEELVQHARRIRRVLEQRLDLVHVRDQRHVDDAQQGGVRRTDERAGAGRATSRWFDAAAAARELQIVGGVRADATVIFAGLCAIGGGGRIAASGASRVAGIVSGRRVRRRRGRFVKVEEGFFAVRGDGTGLSKTVFQV